MIILVASLRIFSFFLEVRHPGWFEDGVYEKHLKTLKGINIGTIINDSPDRILNNGLSLPKCFVRYKPTGDLQRVQQWFDKIKEWGNQGLTEAYFFVQEGGSRMVQTAAIEKSKPQLEALQFFKQVCSKS